MSSLAALVFDHDGTVIDSLPLVVAATNRILSVFGFDQRTPDEVVAGMRLPTAPRMCLAAGLDWDDPRGVDLAQAFYGEARRLAPVPTRVYPGMRELLQLAHTRGLRLALLSNNEGALVREICAHHGLTSQLSIIFGEEDVPAPKPDPQGLQRILAAFDLAPEQVAYIGDSDVDYGVARAAGCLAWGVTWGAHDAAELRTFAWDVLFDAADELIRALDGQLLCHDA
jgi:phosphoglycolate phosphatase